MRQAINVKHLKLTKLWVRINRGARTSSIKKMMIKKGIVEKWEQSSWGKKIAARQTSKGMNDFERFVKMVEKRKVNKALKNAVNIKRKADNLTKEYLPKEQRV